jgi:hypothetical protein
MVKKGLLSAAVLHHQQFVASQAGGDAAEVRGRRSM